MRILIKEEMGWNRKGQFLLGQRLDLKKCVSEWLSALRRVDARNGVIEFQAGTKRGKHGEHK